MTEELNNVQESISLAFSALAAERAAVAATNSSAPHIPTQLFPRLGTYLLRNKMVTKEQLDQALAYQKAQKAEGKDVRLGQTLVDLELVTREDLDRVITEQMIELQNALQQSNRVLEQRVAERTGELQEALNKLMELNQHKINFISNISHELLTPLAKIKGFSIMLADQALGDINEDQHKALHTVNRSVLSLEQLIKDLIRFASTARGEIKVDLRPTDLQKIFNELYREFVDKAQREGLALTLDLAPDFPPVKADAEKLSWALHQFLDNAVKFTPQSGRVILGGRSNGTKALLYVEDTGIGIPEDRISELFVPFHQLDGSSTRHYGGTGLGLAFAKRLIEAHNSDVELESKVDVGTRFSFMLPLA